MYFPSTCSVIVFLRYNKNKNGTTGQTSSSQRSLQLADARSEHPDDDIAVCTT